MTKKALSPYFRESPTPATQLIHLALEFTLKIKSRSHKHISLVITIIFHRPPKIFWGNDHETCNYFFYPTESTSVKQNVISITLAEMCTHEMLPFCCFNFCCH